MINYQGIPCDCLGTYLELGPLELISRSLECRGDAPIYSGRSENRVQLTFARASAPLRMLRSSNSCLSGRWARRFSNTSIVSVLKEFWRAGRVLVSSATVVASVEAVNSVRAHAMQCNRG